MKTDKLKRILETLWDAQELYRQIRKCTSKKMPIPNEVNDLYKTILECLAKELKPLAFGIDAAADKLSEAVDRSIESKLGIKRKMIEKRKKRLKLAKLLTHLANTLTLWVMSAIP